MPDSNLPPPPAGEGPGPPAHASRAERATRAFEAFGGGPKVVVVGAGFGGLACARKLDGEPVNVILLDQHNYHLFTPLLYQVATGLLNPSDIAYPLRTIFRHSRNVRFRQAQVERVDFKRKLVCLSGGDELAYDYLVLATGSADNYFGNQAVADASISLKALSDATHLRNHVLTCLERADAAVDPAARRALLTFVLVGGGPTGVETAGALAELMDIVMGKDYHGISREEARIVLIEGADRLLGAFSARLGRYARRVLERRHVQVLTGKLVKNADDHNVTLADGSTIASETIIWSAGVRPNDATGDPGLPRFRNQRIQLDPQLRVPGAEGAFAIGDLASPQLATDSQLPMLSPPAMQGGRYVAASILEEARGINRERPAFHYVDKGTMATVGRNAGVSHLPGGLEFTGLLGWVTWLVVHLYYLIGFRNRISALLSWAWGYLRHDRPIRIILATAGEAKHHQVRYLALATDYDGTLAHHGEVDPKTLDALRRLAATGRKLILVTGRQVDDLERVFPEVGIFDRLVAENGAVIYDPQRLEVRTLAEPPPAAFVEELRRRGVDPLFVGKVVVATIQPNETIALQVIRELGLELEVILNKGSVMILPASVNKATGLRAALDELGLSAPNIVGIGDAENDQALLEMAGYSVAVANALDSLKAHARLVTDGRAGDGVREVIECLVNDDLRSLDSKRRPTAPA